MLSQDERIWKNLVLERDPKAIPENFEVSSWKLVLKKLKELEIEEERRNRPPTILQRIIHFINTILTDYDASSVVLDSMVSL